MKLHLANAPGLNMFTAYGEGYVEINRQRFEQSLLVLPGKIFEDWQASSLEALSISHFELIAELTPEIVLLGTGSVFRFPQAALTRPLVTAQIGLEVMDTQAACRTYNILAAEGRKVAAAIIL